MKHTARITFIVIILILVILGLTTCNSYNSLVNESEDVTGKWGQVQNNYQTRSDMIGQLVNTVKGQANYEQSTLTKIVNARAQAMAATSQINVNDLSPESVAKVQQAQDMLSKVYAAGVRVINENYPTLQANQGFLGLQAQISEIENRINQSRRDYNKSVQVFNTHIRRFPTNITAGMLGFREKGYFQNAAGTENAPDIDFGNFNDNNGGNANPNNPGRNNPNDNTAPGTNPPSNNNGH